MTMDLAHRAEEDDYHHQEPVYGLQQDEVEDKHQLSNIQLPDMDDANEDNQDQKEDQNDGGPETMTEENDAQSGGGNIYLLLCFSLLGMKGEKDEGSSRKAGNESSKAADETDNDPSDKHDASTPLDPVTATASELMDHLTKVDLKQKDEVIILIC